MKDDYIIVGLICVVIILIGFCFSTYCENKTKQLQAITDRGYCGTYADGTIVIQKCDK